ncbi:hypothetical protein ACC785_38075, partial [Rhizobium ruizarguesonis]
MSPGSAPTIALPSSGGGSKGKGGGGGSKSDDEYQREIDQIKERTVALKNETAAQECLNGIIFELEHQCLAIFSIRFS